MQILSCLTLLPTRKDNTGVLLWINRHFEYAQEGSVRYKIQPSQVLVAFCSERHVQVHLETPCLRLAVLVVHAPKAHKPRDPDVEAFWRDRAQELLRRPQGADCIVLADANGHLGSVPTAHVGSLGAESENQEGASFHHFLCQVDCHLPSTFPGHTGQHWTWRSPGADATTHRIDFVALPLRWQAFVTHSSVWFVWFDVEALQARQDHSPVYVSGLPLRGPPPPHTMLPSAGLQLGHRCQRRAHNSAHAGVSPRRSHHFLAC